MGSAGPRRLYRVFDSRGRRRVRGGYGPREGAPVGVAGASAGLLFPCPSWSSLVAFVLHRKAVRWRYFAPQRRLDPLGGTAKTGKNGTTTTPELEDKETINHEIRGEKTNNARH